MFAVTDDRKKVPVTLTVQHASFTELRVRGGFSGPATFRLLCQARLSVDVVESPLLVKNSTKYPEFEPKFG